MSDSEGDRPLSSKDFFKYMENLNTLIKDGVHTEVTAAIAPFRDKQNDIIEDLTNTKEKVSEIETDHENTKEKVGELQKQIEQLQEHMTTKSSSNFPPLPSQMLPEPLITSTVINTQTPGIEKAVREARKVMKFSPISKERIEYLKEQHAITDDKEAMKSSILEFLEYEMKVPAHITDNIVITKVFPPAKQPNWNYLYAEFSNIATVDLLFTFVMNLGPGINIDIYIPHPLHTRSLAVGQIAFDYRNGVIKHKTKIRYGSADFTLSIKEKGKSGPWTSLKLDTDSLPPLDPSSMSNQTTSPAPGRARLPSKRPRSPPDEDCVERSAKSKKEDISKTPDSHTAKDKIPVDETENSPGKPNPNVATTRDIGIFQPSSCVSPSANLNKNFTFGNKQSSIPIFKNSLNF